MRPGNGDGRRDEAAVDRAAPRRLPPGPARKPAPTIPGTGRANQNGPAGRLDSIESSRPAGP